MTYFSHYRPISETCFLQTRGPLLSKYLQLDCVPLLQPCKFGNPCKCDMGEDVRGKSRSLQYSSTINDVDTLETLEILQKPLDFSCGSGQRECEERADALTDRWRAKNRLRNDGSGNRKRSFGLGGKKSSHH